jgi:hypothetical protein
LAAPSDVPANVPAAPASPFKSPTYPQRVHVQERAKWNALLAHWEARVAEAGKKLESLGNHPEKATYHRLYVQMLGSRDQIADAVKRLPGEVGDLYDEDRHRVELAVAALERIGKAWK